MSSVPAVAERAGWQTRRVRRLPQIAALYVGAICLAALAAAAASLAHHGADGHDWTAFALLLPLAAVAPFFRVAVGRNYSLHTGAAFIVAGALVLHPLMVLALVAALHIPQFVRGRYPWYIQLFNLANYVLSALAAWLAVGVIRGDGDFRFAAAGVAAAITFVAVNHALLAVMLRLGRGHSFRAERPLLLVRARDRTRARRPRCSGRSLRPLQPLDPARADRAARACSPIARHGGAAARERGALPDHVRRGADSDHAVRPRRQSPRREPLRGIAVRLRRAGARGQAPDRAAASGRRCRRKRSVRRAGEGRA